MDLKLFLTVFGTMFLAELGDKTQLATLLFAARSPTSLATVFVAASAALIVSCALGVAAGGLLTQHLNPRWLTYAAGAAFIAIGVVTLLRA